jgi:hypothetical protein
MNKSRSGWRLIIRNQNLKPGDARRGCPLDGPCMYPDGDDVTCDICWSRCYPAKREGCCWELCVVINFDFNRRGNPQGDISMKKFNEEFLCDVIIGSPEEDLYYRSKRQGTWKYSDYLIVMQIIEKADKKTFPDDSRFKFNQFNPQPDTKITMNIKIDKMEFEQVENDDGFMEEVNDEI